MRPRLLALAAFAATLSATAHAQPAPKAEAKPEAPPAAPPAPLPNKWMGPEYVLGSPKAKVTLVEYASASCPHCARFDANVFPQLKAAYVDTGKVRYVFREFLTPPENVAAVGFLLARCAGEDKYMGVVEQVFRAQPEIYQLGEQGKDLKPVFSRIAKANGLSDAQLDACVNDKAGVDALNARIAKAENVDKIESTPTLIANGKQLKQPAGKEWDFAALDAQLKPLVGGGAAKPSAKKASVKP